MTNQGPINPATIGAMQPQATGGGGSAIGGGGMFGGLLRDVQLSGLSTQGWSGKNIMDGGIAGLNSGNKKPPGLASQLGLTPKAIMESLAQIAKNDPVVQGGMQAVAQQMSGGVENVPMAQSAQLSASSATPTMASGGAGWSMEA